MLCHLTCALCIILHSLWCLLWMWSAKSCLVKAQFYSYPKWMTAPCHVSDLLVLFLYIILFKPCIFVLKDHIILQLSLVALNYCKL